MPLTNPSARPRRARRPAGRTPLRLLFVERDPAVAARMCVALEASGRRVEPGVVHRTEDLPEALAGGPWDAALVGPGLPDLPPTRALERVREAFPGLPVLLLTDAPEDAGARGLLAESATVVAPRRAPDRLPRILERVLEQHRAEVARDESVARHRAIFENAAWGIAVNTLEGRILDVNPALVGMLGYPSRAALLERNMRSDVYEDPDERDRLVAEALGEGQFAPRDVRWRRRDGSVLTVRITGRPMVEPGGRVRAIEILVEDVTEKRELERRLQGVQRLEAIGRLAGGVAHDFNNLLTVISGYDEILLAELPPEGPLREAAHQIQEAARRATELTRQLLAFGRRQVMKPVRVDLNALVAGMKGLVARLIGEDVELGFQLHEGLWPVKADPAQLEQVIMNLVINARDALPEGGHIRVETTNAALEDPGAAAGERVEPGVYVRLTVSDDGVGMDADTVARAFEPFFTTKAPGGGSGLGLATVYGIVKQSGGYVWAYSEPGRGTTVRTYLPRARGSDAAPEPATRPARAGHAGGGGETVLVVEDEEIVRQLVSQLLDHAGYQVLPAMNGEQALSVSGRHPGAIHLLLTDMVLPGMAGGDLAARLCRDRPGLRVLFTSGYADRMVLDPGLLGAGHEFLAKPFTRDALLEKVRTTLGARLER